MSEGFLNWKMVSPWFPHSYVFVLNSWEPRPANHGFHRFLRCPIFSVLIWVGDRNGRAASQPCKCGRNSQGPEKVAMETEMPGHMEMEWDGNEAFIHIFLFLHSPSYLQASCWITIWCYCAFAADPVVVDQPGPLSSRGRCNKQTPSWTTIWVCQWCTPKSHGQEMPRICWEHHFLIFWTTQIP